MLHTERVEHKADEPVVRCKWQEKSVREDDVLQESLSTVLKARVSGLP
jgi:hypothetical protein